MIAYEYTCSYSLALRKRSEVVWPSFMQYWLRPPPSPCNVSYEWFPPQLLISAPLTIKACPLAPILHVNRILLTMTMILIGFAVPIQPIFTTSYIVKKTIDISITVAKLYPLHCISFMLLQCLTIEILNPSYVIRVEFYIWDVACVERIHDCPVDVCMF